MVNQLALIYILAFVTFILTLGLIFTHIYVKQVYKGINQWIYGILIETVAFILIASRAYLPDFFIFLIGNLLLVIGLIYFYRGTILFIEEKPMYKDIYILSAVTTIMMLTFYFMFPNRDVRQITMSVFIIYITVKIIYASSKTTNPNISKYLIPLKLASVLFIVLQTTRIIFIITGISGDPFMASDMIMDEALMLLVAVFMLILAFFMTIGVNIRAVAELKTERLKLEHLSLTDFLTTLPNRRMLIQYMDLLIHQEKKFAVVMMDMDDFKSVNDKYGHTVGDEVIKAYANRLASVKRKQDFVARYGGDEFIVIIDDYADDTELVNLIKNKLETINSCIIIEKISVYINASVGISVYPLHAKDVTSMITYADEALYKVKASGKNNIAFYEMKN